MPPKSVSLDHFNDAIDDLKNAQKKNHNELMNLVKELTNELKEEKEKNSSLRNKVAMLTRHVSSLMKTVSNVKSLAEDNEQYSRRNNIIIKNIPPADSSEEETGDICLQKVSSAISDMGIELPANAIDRAHRVGKPRKTLKYGEQQSVIVRFTSWRDRTLVYRARKDSGLVISLDISKARQDLLYKVRSELVERYPDAVFAFADVNCNLSVKFASGFKFFESWDGAKDLFRRYGGIPVEADNNDENDDDEEEVSDIENDA